MRNIFRGLAIVASLIGSPAFSQTSANFTYGQVPTVQQWNNLFASKQDYLGAPSLLISGGTLTGRLVTAPSTSVLAGFNISPGTAPTVPTNGDMWTTSAGLFVRINGGTVGPLGSGGGGGSITLNSGTNFGITAPGVMSLGNTYVIGDITDQLHIASLGLGTTSPSSVLEAVDASNVTTRGITGTNYYAGINGALFNGRHARGSAVSPTATQANDFLASFGGVGFGASAWGSGIRGSYAVLAAENWTDTAQGTYLRLDTTPTGSTTIAERVRIDNAGNVGIGTTTPGSLLDVNGTSNFSGAAVFGSGITVTGTVAATTVTGAWGGTTIPPNKGGTGLATLTTHAVMLGEGTGNVAFATTGTGGRVLIDQGSGSDPAFTAISGALTLTSGGVASLANTAVTSGTYGSATQVGQFTVGADGRITAASNVGISGGGGTSPGGTSGQVQYNSSGSFGGLTVGGDGTLNTGTGALVVTKTNGVAFGALATLGAGTGLSSSGGNLVITNTVTGAGPIGSATVTPIITFNSQGQLTTVTSATIAPAASSITGGAALTKTDDTNVTMTLGGAPSTALLGASSITLGWTGTLASSRGGTANGFFTVSGPATSAKTFTFPNASANVLTDNAAVTVAQGGTGLATLTTHAVLLGEGTGNVAFASSGTGGRLLIDQGSGVDPAFTVLSGDATVTSGGVISVNALHSGAFANPSASVALAAVNGSATTAMRSDAAPALSQAIAPTWTAQHIHNVASTIVSATTATLDDINVQAATTTITGNTGSPITKLSKVGIYRPTLTDASAVTVTDAASLYVDNSPLAAGSVTISNAWSIRVGAGNVSFPGTGNVLGTITSATWNGGVIAGLYGGTGLSTAAIGDLIYASATTPTWSRLAAVATGSILASGGVNTAPAWSSTPTLGVAGSSVGSLSFANATSGTIKLQPTTGALGSAVLTLPDVTDTLVGLAATQTLTNKTLASSTDVVGGVTMTLGSDATGDIYYRNVSGVLTRLAAGSTFNALTVSGGLPAWGQINLAQSSAVTGVLGASNGGPGTTSFGAGGSTSNYATLGGGLIVQWGTVFVAANSTTAVTFGLTFPNAAYGGQVTDTGGATSGLAAPQYVSLTTTGVTIVNNYVSGQNMTYFMWGS